MSTEETWVEKAAWGDGPWVREPDRVEWHDEPTGLACLMLRNEHLGFWCGYVGLPPGHPLHGVTVENLPDTVHAAAHGEVNYARRCMEDPRPQRERVCHVPRPGESDDVWWLGFDCGHLWDLAPGIDALLGGPILTSTYRDRAYVTRAVGLLAYVCARQID